MKTFDSLGLILYGDRVEWSGITLDSNGQPTGLAEAGATTFENGIVIENGKEMSTTAIRGDARRMRKHYHNRRTRKIKLIEVLSEEGLCPAVSKAELNEWRHTKRCNLNEEFKKWTKTEASLDSTRNPHLCRHLALTSDLDLGEEKDRFILGRALYHIAMKRGFDSNAIDEDVRNDMSGPVKKEIAELDSEMAAMGCDTLGEFYYRCYCQHIRIRGRHTGQTEHVMKEFDRVCERQGIGAETAGKLRDALFFRRGPGRLASPGACDVEPSKTRCLSSHPYFEEFRMWQTINNIRIHEAGTDGTRCLNDVEKLLILPLFFRESKENFKFGEIAKRIAGKRTFCCGNGRGEYALRFNYDSDQNIKGCPTSVAFMKATGQDTKDPEACRDWKAGLLARTAGKIGDEFTAVDRLVTYLTWYRRLEDKQRKMKADSGTAAEWLDMWYGIRGPEAEKLLERNFQDDRANLSIYVIRRILPEMIAGETYARALVLGSLDRAVPQERLAAIRGGVICTMQDTEAIKSFFGGSWQEAVKEFLHDNGLRTSKIWFPNSTQGYRAGLDARTGKTILNDPRSASLRNKHEEKILFVTKRILNRLIIDGKIDSHTRINVCATGAVNTSNAKLAYGRWIKSGAERNEEYRKALMEHFPDMNFVTDEMVVKYRLWEEQGHVDIYTGRTIGLDNIFGPNPTVAVDHIVPLSRGGSNALTNLVLTDMQFNLFRKGAHIPAELEDEDYAAIMDRIESLGWSVNAEDARHAWKSSQTKARTAVGDNKDNLLQKAHLKRMEYEYWSGKLKGFHMKEVPAGYSGRTYNCGAEARRILEKWLPTVFNRVRMYSEDEIATFRESWGFEPKGDMAGQGDRQIDCIDSTVLACLNGKVLKDWRSYWFRREGSSHYYDNFETPKPWETFTEDVTEASEGLTVKHTGGCRYNKRTKRKVRDSKGRIVRKADGTPLYSQGNTIRQGIHDDKIYAARRDDKDNIRYCIKMPLPTKTDKNIAAISSIIDKCVDKGMAEAMRTWASDVNSGETFFWNGNPVRSVRCWANVTNPKRIRKHIHESDREERRYAYAVGSGNCTTVLFENAKGKPESLTLNPVDENPVAGKDTKQKLTQGETYIMYEKSPEEINWDDPKELNRRRYRIKGGQNGRNRQLKIQRTAAVYDPKDKPDFGKWTRESGDSVVLYAQHFKGVPDK